MNRYDWLIFVFKLVVDSETIAKARDLIARLEDAEGDGADKRKIVEEVILPAIKFGGVYVARALIETLLKKIRAKNEP